MQRPLLQLRNDLIPLLELMAQLIVLRPRLLEFPVPSTLSILNPFDELTLYYAQFERFMRLEFNLYFIQHIPLSPDSVGQIIDLFN